MKPVRIQRKRTRGWKMPENTVSVCRPGVFGNPFIINSHVKPGSAHGAVYFAVPTQDDAVECYREMLKVDDERMRWLRDKIMSELPGKNLACFCPLDQPCHADVLLELANPPHTGDD